MKPLDRTGVIRASLSVFIRGIVAILLVIATLLVVVAIFGSEIFQQSVSMFICGLVGLLPLIGLVLAASAIVNGIRLRRAYSDSNPANRYRKWGIVLGSLGVLLNFCAVAIAIIRLITIANRGYWIDME